MEPESSRTTLPPNFVRVGNAVYQQIRDLLSMLRWFELQKRLVFSYEPDGDLSTFAFCMNGMQVSGRSGLKISVSVCWQQLNLNRTFTVDEDQEEPGLSKASIEMLRTALAAAIDCYDPEGAARCAQIFAQILAIVIHVDGAAEVTRYKTAPAEPDGGDFTINGVNYGLSTHLSEVYLHVNAGSASFNCQLTDGRVDAEVAIRLKQALLDRKASLLAVD